MRVTPLICFGVAMVVGPGCKSDTKARARAEMTAAVEKMRGFADQVCACKDKACGDRVMEAMNAWSAEMAKKTTSEPAKPDEVTIKEMTRIGERFATCLTKVMAPAPEPDPTPVLAVPVAPPQPTLPASLTPPFAADQVLAAARTWMQATHPGLTMDSLRLAYVDAQGVLDAEAGAVELHLARVRPDDDPNRKLGAPIVRPKERLRDCPRMSFTAQGAWVPATIAYCDDVPLLSAHCSVAEIWKRSLAKGAPAEGLAVLTLKHNGKAPFWRFAISDPPRGVNFVFHTPDDCELAVEKPAAPADDGLLPPKRDAAPTTPAAPSRKPPPTRAVQPTTPCDPFSSRGGCP